MCSQEHLRVLPTTYLKPRCFSYGKPQHFSFPLKIMQSCRVKGNKSPRCRSKETVLQNQGSNFTITAVFLLPVHSKRTGLGISYTKSKLLSTCVPETSNGLACLTLFFSFVINLFLIYISINIRRTDLM